MVDRSHFIISKFKPLLRVIFLCLLLIHFRGTNLLGQIEVNLSIENALIENDDFLFDIYFVRISDPGTGDCYLGDADLIIRFNPLAFNNPSISKIGPAPGYCTFIPTLSNAGNDLFTHFTYYYSTSASINENEIIINLSGGSPGDQDAFNSSIAKIDAAVSTHRIGRFKISGITSPSDNPDLKWKTKGHGLKTIVSTLENLPPFTSSPVLLQTDSNTCPDNITITQSPVDSGHYQAAIELSSEATQGANTVVNFVAGDQVNILPNFSVPLGAQLTINIGGCQ